MAATPVSSSAAAVAVVVEDGIVLPAVSAEANKKKRKRTEAERLAEEAAKKARKEEREATWAAERVEKQKHKDEQQKLREKQRARNHARQEMQRQAAMAQNAAKRSKLAAVRAASRKQQAALPVVLKKEKRPLPNHNNSHSGLLTTPTVICAQLGLELWDRLLTADVWGLVGEYVEFEPGTVLVKRQLRESWTPPSDWDNITGLGMLCMGANWSSLYSLRYHLFTVVAAKLKLRTVATPAEQLLVQQRLAAWKQHCRTLPKNAIFHGRVQLESDQRSRYARGLSDWVRWHEGRRLGRSKKHHADVNTHYFELYNEARHGVLCELPDIPL